MNEDSRSETDPLDRDLTEDLRAGRFAPATFEFAKKDTTVNLRLSKGLLDATKQAAARAGLSHQSFMRRAIEREVLAERDGET